MSIKQHKIGAVHFLSDIKGFCQKFKERLAVSICERQKSGVYLH